MSAPRDHYSTNNNDDDYQSHDNNDNSSSDGAYHQEIDRTQHITAVSSHTDAQHGDTDTDRSGVILEDIDTKRSIAPTALALAALSSQENETENNIGQHPDRSSSSKAAGDMFPPLNRAYMLHRDFLRTSDVNANHIDGADVSPSAFASDGVHFSDDAYHKSQNPGNLSTYTFPVDSATSSLSAAIRRYIDDGKPYATSSVKSFGSNVGSDDCGGSLDVETHSIGARSVHSQEDILPVAMPDPDPETVAVASLSINPVDNGDLRSFVGNMYNNVSARQQHSRYMHLPLQRFHNNQVQFGNAVDDGGVEEDFETSIGSDSHRTPLNWNDPRIDHDESSDPTRRSQGMNLTRPTPSRSRSRSRSPPL